MGITSPIIFFKGVSSNYNKEKGKRTSQNRDVILKRSLKHNT
jgi:hypothetical protein